MKTLKKLLVRLVLLVVVLLVVVVLARNYIVKVAVPIAAKSAANLKVTVASVDIGLALNRLGIEGFVLNNPAGFPDEAMLSVPTLKTEYSPLSMLSDRIEVRSLELDIADVVIVKNKDGKYNVMSIVPPKKEKPGTEQPPTTEPKKEPGKKKELKLDYLKFHIGTVTYKDYASDPPVVKTANIDLTQEAKDITDPTSIALLIVTKAAISGAKDIPELGVLAAGGLLPDISGAANETLKKVEELGGKDVKDAVKNVTEGIGNILK